MISKLSQFKFVKLQFILFLLLTSFLISCQPQKTKILFSKAVGSSSYEQYVKWIQNSYPDVECINTYELDYDDALDLLTGSHGLVLTGGPDVHPGRFGRAADSVFCSIDLYRDTLEFALIEKALELKIPILGICRGEQIINVALGGSLIVDIPTEVEEHVIHQKSESYNSFHDILIMENSILNDTEEAITAKVNSNHHQSVGKLADDLKATAFTSDGIVEAFEWNEPDGKSFMLAVQWHPERMEKDDLLAKKILNIFLKSVDIYSKNI